MMTFATLSPEADLNFLARRIAGTWATASWPGLRRLKVEATADTIRVTGNVGTFFEKQQAYHWARRLAEGVLIEEEIEVVSRQPATRERGQNHWPNQQTQRAS